jgi:thioredoxin reductase
VSVVVVGGGPAGLACAVELRRRGVQDVLVLDREGQAGGIPRHCAHQGFGLRDLHRAMSGPRYGRRYVELARAAGALVREAAMVTGCSADGELEVTSPDGREALRPDAVVLATGCRERPRAARLVPGSRPAGVFTTGQLQQLVELGVAGIGRRALVVGAEHVSFSAVVTLHHARARVVGMTTELPRHQSLSVFRLGARLRYRAPLWTRTAVSGIYGHSRVEEVELTDVDDGSTRRAACDTVVFTADWIPDHELAVTAGLELDPGTLGPQVDTSLRTTRPGMFAVGNLLHGAEPADVAALSGRHAAVAVSRWLSGDEPWPAPGVPIMCRRPLLWISPNAIDPGGRLPPRARFALRSAAFVNQVEIEIRQGARVLWTGRVRRLVPGRSRSLAAEWISRVDPQGAPIEVAVGGVIDS